MTNGTRAHPHTSVQLFEARLRELSAMPIGHSKGIPTCLLMLIPRTSETTPPQQRSFVTRRAVMCSSGSEPARVTWRCGCR